MNLIKSFKNSTLNVSNWKYLFCWSIWQQIFMQLSETKIYSYTAMVRQAFTFNWEFYKTEYLIWYKGSHSLMQWKMWKSDFSLHFGRRSAVYLLGLSASETAFFLWEQGLWEKKSCSQTPTLAWVTPTACRLSAVILSAPEILHFLPDTVQ